MTTTIILLLILTLLLGAVGSVMVQTLITGTPPMPTSPVVLPTVVAAVRRSLPESPPEPPQSRRRAVVLDAGCGWGTLVMALAATIPEIEARGVERSLVPCLYAKVRSALFGLAAPLVGAGEPRRGRGRWSARGYVGSRPRISVRCGDLFREPMEDVDVLITYLSTGHMKRLKQIEDRLPPVLVSVAFALPGATPAVTYQVDDPFRTPVYVYRL